MARATVVFFNRVRGFGFATPDTRRENDVFVHVSRLPADRKFLLEGDRIEYELGEHDSRLCAVNVRLISSGALKALGTPGGQPQADSPATVLGRLGSKGDARP